jgi:hypothetical protein
MSRDFTERQIDNSEKIVIRDDRTQKIQTVIFPHTTQVGLGDTRYQSKLNVQGSIHSSGSLQLGELSATPEQPGDGSGGIFYVKSDGKPYFRSYEQAEIDLTSGGGGGGAVSSVANGANNRIATFSSANALNGEENLTFSGSELLIAGSLRATNWLWSQKTHDGDTGGLYLDNLSTHANAAVSSHFRLDNDSGTQKYAAKITVGKVQDWDSDANTDAYMSFLVMSDGSSAAEIMRFQNGRVGIGTSTPDEPLHAKESIATSGVSNSVLKLETYSSNGFQEGDGPGIKFSGGDAGAASNTIGRIYSARDGADNEGKIGFMAGTDGAEEFMNISSAGNVGIGYASSVTSAKFMVLGAMMSQRSANGNTDHLTLHNYNVGASAAASLRYILTDDAGDKNAARIKVGKVQDWNNAGNTDAYMSFSTIVDDTESETMRIQNGNVGIGTTAPSANLHITNVSGGKLLRLDTGANSGNDPQLFITGQAGDTVEGFALNYDNNTGDIRYDVYFTNGDHIWRLKQDSDADPSEGFEGMRLTNDGDFGIGTATPGYKLHVLTDEALKGEVAVTQINDSSATDGANFRMFRARGTKASPTIVENGDTLGVITFHGYDGTDYDTSAGQIWCEVDGTPAGNDMPGRLVFKTTPDGSSTPAERMRITSTGKVGIGTTDPTYEVDVRADSARLQVKSSTSTALMFIDAATNHDAILYFRENGNNKWLVGNDADDDLLKFDNNNSFASPAMTISTAGVVTAGKFVGITYGTKAINADVATASRTFMPISDQYFSDDITPALAYGPYVWMAPCDGKFIKIRAKMESAAGNSFFKMYTVTAAPGGTIGDPLAGSDTGLSGATVTNTVSVSANTAHTFTFSNATFSAGDIIALSFDGTNMPNQMIASLIIEYDWSTV